MKIELSSGFICLCLVIALGLYPNVFNQFAEAFVHTDSSIYDTKSDRVTEIPTAISECSIKDDISCVQTSTLDTNPKTPLEKAYPVQVVTSQDHKLDTAPLKSDK